MNFIQRYIIRKEIQAAQKAVSMNKGWRTKTGGVATMLIAFGQIIQDFLKPDYKAIQHTDIPMLLAGLVVLGVVGKFEKLTKALNDLFPDE